jgi:hypothetical protein
MKNIKFLPLLISIVFAACHSSSNSDGKRDSIASIESGPGKIVDERYLIVPGISVGEISIGEDVEQVGQKLGKPDAGDAAMGKAWGIWYSKDTSGEIKNEFAVYSSYRDTSMKVKDVKQIRITSNQFKTQDGFSVERTLIDTQMKFPGIERTSTYLNENKDSVVIYDSKKEGIGFEFINGKSIALTVHAKDQAVNGTYLTLHPEWKQVSN